MIVSGPNTLCKRLCGKIGSAVFGFGLLVGGASLVLADAGHQHKKGEITVKSDRKVEPAFDIVHAKVSATDKWLVFHMHVSGMAGKKRPKAAGTLAKAPVFSYVWPTNLDSSAVGFDREQGILALAVTSHPDFDDTPLFDENNDGDLDNDGGDWHSHWVVLVKDKSCGAGLKVKDIPEGSKPKLPATWPGFPIFLDSPGFSPKLSKKSVEVRVPLALIGQKKGFSYDGVTSGLQVNESIHAPLLCVKDVFKIASDDLSLPGKVE